MIEGEAAYAGAVDRVVAAIGPDRWDDLPPGLRERIQCQVIADARERLGEEYRKLFG